MMFPVVGLGNPGTDYAKTRHNAGFWVVQYLADKLGLVFSQGLFSAHAEAGCPASRLAELWPDLEFSPDARLILIKPLTWMNRSGDILPGLYQHWSDKGHEVALPIVVVDQMDLGPGELRFKSRGGTAGHNGLKSLVAVLEQDFFPLYFGIGRPAPGIAVVDHVLGVPWGDEEAAEQAAIPRAARGIAVCISRGIEAAMHETNRKAPSDS